MTGTLDVVQPVRRRGGRSRVAWPVAAWPALDREAWARAISPADDLLDENGAAAGWRAATRLSAAGTYGRWLAHLDAAGTLDPTADPAARVTPEAINGYLAALREKVVPVTLATYIAMLVMAMKAMAPGYDWAWLIHLHSRLKCRATPSRDKRARVVSAEGLLALGLDLMRDAEATAAGDDGRATAVAALAFRDGLMIALLTSRPLRKRNFLSIEIGQHLVRERTGWQLRFAGTETKNHRPIEVTIPQALEAALVRYLEHWRPRILQIGRQNHPQGPHQGYAAGNRLWVNIEGAALGSPGQRKALLQRTLARFGVAVNPHLFRDCVATSIAAQDPDHVRIAAQMLGHHSLQTTERYYVIADGRASIGKHQDRIRALRRGSQKGRQRGTMER